MLKSAKSHLVLLLSVVTLTLADSSPECYAASSPPEGKYQLIKTSSSGTLMNLGTMEIRGSTYRLADEEKFYSFSVGPDANITWSHGLGLPDGWTITSSNYAGANSAGEPMIKIHYHTTSGSDDSMEAVKQ